MTDLSQGSFFAAELEVARRANSEHDEAMRVHRAQRLEARRAELRLETAAWKDGPWAERVNALLDKLAEAGDPAREMRDMILFGINDAAKLGRLDERHVSFVEEHARKEVARVGSQGRVVAVDWRPRTLDDLAGVHPACRQLPEPLQVAAIAKMNELGAGLAKLGFKSELEVDASCPRPAQDLAHGVREVHTALILLGVNRYRNARGYKASSEARIEYAEDYASQVLCIDSRDHPGVKMDLPLTTDGLRQERRPRARAERPADAVAEARAAEPSGVYVGKIVEASDDRLVQKVGRDPRDLVTHTRAAVCGDDARVGDVVTISYEMGMARLANQSLAKAGVAR